MPANLNKVFLMGNLTRDPEMRTLPSGTTVCAFGVAVNRQFVNAAGVTQEEACFIDVSAFGRSGEIVAQYLRKGSPIFVEGRLHFEQWDERETGKKRSRLSVTAERVQLIGAPTGRDGSYAEDDQADAASAPGGWQQPGTPNAGWQRPQGGSPPAGGWQRQAPQRGPAAPQGGWQRQAPAAPQGGWQQQPAPNSQAQGAPQGNWQPPPPQQPPPPNSPAPAAPPAMPQFEPLPEESGSGGDDLPF